MKERKGAYKFINEEFLASLQNVDTRDDTAKLNDLRESVRRLVGALNGWWSLDPDAPPHEWVRAERIAREARDALVNEHPELSALIDGKGDQT